VTRFDDLTLELRGLVLVRALLETRGASTTDLELHTAAINRVRSELARLAPMEVRAA
jgi:hypothetical protein